MFPGIHNPTSTAFTDLMCSFCQEMAGSEAATCASGSSVSGRSCRLDMSSPQRDTGPVNSAEAKKADPRMSEKKCCELSATFSNSIRASASTEQLSQPLPVKSALNVPFGYISMIHFKGAKYMQWRPVCLLLNLSGFELKTKWIHPCGRTCVMPSVVSVVLK